MKKTVPDSEHCLISALFPKFHVWVEIDGQPMPIYSKDQQENKAVGYMEAIEGKEFTVNWADLRTSRPDDPFTTRVYVDENEAAWRYTVKSGREISKVIKNLGTIRVTYCRIENLRDSEIGVRAPEETKPIHEKNKKARLSHQAAFGEKRAITAGRHSTFNWIDAEEKPLQIFEFRYRSRQLLQLEGHIPDSPEPTPRPSPEPIPDAVENPEEVQRRAEIALLRERLDALERATQGSSQAGPSGLKRVKTEAGQDRDTKKIKKEQGTSSSGSGAAKGKKKKEVLVLSDSD